MSLVNSDSFTSSSPIWMPFMCLPCLIFAASTSSTGLNNSGESRHGCHVPDLKGKAFRVSPLSMMLAMGLSHT